jgi:hypothetical protein
MKLVVKLPKDKLPFLGIVFPSSYQANQTNEDLVLDHKEDIYRMILEFTGTVLNLKLICDEKVIIRTYRNVDYDKEKLKSWVMITRKGTAFNFGHIYMQSNKEIVVKNYKNRKLFVLRLNKYEIQSN